MKNSTSPYTHTARPMLALLSLVCLSLLPAVVSKLAISASADKSISGQGASSQLDAGREATLRQLHSQLKSRSRFSSEETQILLRFNNGEPISNIEADIVISRALFDRYVERKALSPEQKKLLIQYKQFLAQAGRHIADVEEKPAGQQAAVSSELIPSVGTPSVCSSLDYTITQATGTSIVPGTTDTGNHCDDCTTLITLPFAFTLYDQTFTTARISSNGNLQFVGTNADFSSTCLPNAGFSYTIFAFWDDLFTQDTASGQGVFTSISGSAPNRIFNIEWRTKFCCSNGTPIFDFEIRLYENSTRFDLVYGLGTNMSSFTTVGVQRTGVMPDDCFTQFACHQPTAVFPGLTLTFIPGFDICVQDDAKDTLLRFNSTTGAYLFQDCRKGIALSGVGQVSTYFCKLQLFDRGPDPKRPDRSVSALVNTCTKVGDASVSAFSPRQTFAIHDSNITNNTCTCQ